MRKLLLVFQALVLASGIGVATAAASAPQVAASSTFTCMYFPNPTVELLWSHVCHF